MDIASKLVLVGVLFGFVALVLLPISLFTESRVAIAVNILAGVIMALSFLTAIVVA